MALFRLEFIKPGSEFRLLKSRLANSLKVPAQGDLTDRLPRRETLNALVWSDFHSLGVGDEAGGGGGGAKQIDACSLGYNELDFFSENKEYRPFDGCKIEI